MLHNINLTKMGRGAVKTPSPNSYVATSAHSKKIPKDLDLLVRCLEKKVTK